MYAVLRTGGKQYKVEPGLELDIERIPGSVGDSVVFSDVLLAANESEVKVGRPLVDGVSIQGEILAQKRGSKLIIFKKLRRHNKQLKKGHRQELTRVRIRDIKGLS